MIFIQYYSNSIKCSFNKLIYFFIHNCYIFKYLTMKVKDYGSNDTSTKEKMDASFSPSDIDINLDFINKNILSGFYISKNIEETEKLQKSDHIKDKINQLYENHKLFDKKLLKSDLILDNIINNNSNISPNENTNINSNNCINSIDFDKNIIVLNKLHLKEFNNINKEIKNEKKNELISKKGEIINMTINEKFNYNKEVSNSIKTSYEYLTNNFVDSFDNFYQIKSNNNFPNEIIEKFLERKRNKNKEKNNSNIISSFGQNPLESLKNIQNDLIDTFPPPKGSKMSLKQYKTNKKNLKDQNILLQKYIKSFPVFNCPESKLFKVNECYSFNKITEEKNINIINNVLNKCIKKNNNYIMEINEEEEKDNKNKMKDDSEDETINRYLKKKIMNIKKFKSKNKN